METPVETKPKRNPWALGCLVFAGAVVLIGGGIGAYYYHKYVDFGEAAGRAEVDAAAYRAAGMPWEAKDQRVPARDDQNALPFIQQAGKIIDEKGFSKESTAIQLLLAKQSMAEAAGKLGQFASVVSLADKAVQRPFLDLHVKWDMGADLFFPELATIKGMERALCLQAQLDSELKNREAAVKDLRTAWKLSLLVPQDPSLISMLTEVTCQRIVLDAIQRCAAVMKEDPAALRELETIIGHPKDLPSLSSGLRGEAYVGLATIRNIKTLNRTLDQELRGDPKKDIDESGIVHTGIPTNTQQRAFAARHFEVWTEAKAAMDKYPDSPEGLRQELRKIDEKWADRTPLSYLVVSIVFPLYEHAATAVVENQAETVATQGLLEALQIKARTGKWPSKIGDIPGFLVDPFNGHPMLMKQTSDSFRVYSVGPNLRDDGGVRKTEIKDDAKKDDYDLVASYPPRVIKGE